MTDALSFMSSLRWQDFLDIGLNGFILFRLYVLFRGSGLIRVMPVVVILWALRGVALFAGLVVTSWAIQGIIAAAALILIIVFRDDIASVFQAGNLKTFLWGLPSHGNITSMDIIAQTTFEMGKNKIGALMVFPRTKEINNIIQGGIDWDGKLSREMLLSIFWDKNPVHDGAVIIKQNRISRVGAILPLSRRSDLPSRYGTRHRAGLGLAESSDCLVIIVSEESGRVTVVKGTEIKDVRNVAQLKIIMEGHLGNGKKKKSALWKNFFEYGTSALVCLALVTGIWFGLSRGRETLKSIVVPLEYTDIQKDFEIIESSTNTVTLHLGGSVPLLKSLGPKQIKVLLKLNAASAGENIYTVSGKNIILPPGIHLKKVEPSSVKLVLDGTVTRQLPIQLNWTGKLSEELILANAQMTPQNITVTGPRKVLKTITTLYTEKIPLDTIQTSGTREVAVILQPSSLNVADKKNRVKVSYTVVKREKAPVL
ncbi:TIGR00159 family protein [Desulfocicer vacuolatum DSM 3385]|uniref:Diadenylate cyclase n=1 Tax=Desulfocicer vacuolatum DSM 3385 TaxID=1121400 RepID=A0A1W1YKQ5_9BACT|nr:diadenylate cyclase [Desulfocicer vacuolatum]SMC36767.1 TIGR00159 family protein [Desulfocicer vacuolatum DSM 3385]